MGIYNRCPRLYQDLRQNGFTLPSESYLRQRRNIIRQTPGVTNDMMQLMKAEAEKLEVSMAGRCGGLMFDEMAVQVDQML